MSFYDYTKDFVLSAKELFKYRVKRDTTIPSKGGQKDFEPDGSWIQSKALEAFMQERISVLSEPRVEKLKNLVEGVWDEEQHLVNLQKPGKFWAHMGFTDQRRNWLYPEEALFLMESNTLEVYNHGIPLSIQEAYDVLLGSDVNLEEYQVFSHLRRLGYVVLRHEEHPVITPYERQLNLDKYMSKQSFKDRKGKFLQKGKTAVKNRGKQEGDQQRLNSSSAAKLSKTAAVQDFENKDNEKNSCKESEGIAKKDENDSTDTQSSLLNKTTDTSVSDLIFPAKVSTEKTSTDLLDDAEGNVNDPESMDLQSNKRSKPNSTDASPVSTKKVHQETISRNADMMSEQKSNRDVLILQGLDSSFSSTPSRFYENQWSSCFQKVGTAEQSQQYGTDCSKTEEPMDIDQSRDSQGQAGNAAELRGTSAESCYLSFPDIGNKAKVNLALPDAAFLPDNVEINVEEKDLLYFDVAEYRHKNPPRGKNRRAQKEEERDARIQALQFSFAEWMQGKLEKTGSNWKEYKENVAKRKAEAASSTPVDHLWKGSVTPLVKPQDASSYENILNCLRIIKPAENESLSPDSDCLLDVKVTYDIHLPDSRFRKSMPGIPNHRVCVTKCSSKPPGLAELQQVWSRFRDDVPLLWAVVDSGEIAFYCFDSSHTIQALS